MAMTNRRLPGCVLSVDPLITFSKRAPALGVGLGLIGHRLDLAKAGPSFNILTLAWTHEGDGQAKRLKQELDAFAETAPLARFIVLANTETEHQSLHRHGIESVVGNILCLADTERFRIVAPASDASRFDAVYVAGFQPFKRHALACDITSLLLLYWPPGPIEAISMRQTLPHATFGNHALQDGVFSWLEGEAYCQQLGRASVGLCLSAEEGPMRASIEYMLCGLPVVTTPARGGRVEMLSGPHLSVVPPDPKAIAAAVAEVAEAKPDPFQIRSTILDRIGKERQALLHGVNQWLANHAAPLLDDVMLEQMVRNGVWRARPEAEIFEGIIGR